MNLYEAKERKRVGGASVWLKIPGQQRGGTAFELTLTVAACWASYQLQAGAATNQAG